MCWCVSVEHHDEFVCLFLESYVVTTQSQKYRNMKSLTKNKPKISNVQEESQKDSGD